MKEKNVKQHLIPDAFNKVNCQRQPCLLMSLQNLRLCNLSDGQEERILTHSLESSSLTGLERFFQKHSFSLKGSSPCTTDSLGSTNSYQ